MKKAKCLFCHISWQQWHASLAIKYTSTTKSSYELLAEDKTLLEATIKLVRGYDKQFAKIYR